jgi:hypothetical protein
VPTGFWWGTLRKRDHLEDLGVDGMMLLKLIFKMWGWGDMDWINLAQGRERWRALVNAGMTFWLP